MQIHTFDPRLYPEHYTRARTLVCPIMSFKWTLQPLKLSQAPLLMNILNLVLKVAHIPKSKHIDKLLAFTKQLHS